MSNSFRSKANANVRTFIDGLINPLPEKAVLQTNFICRKINEDDHRRQYSNSTVAALMRERDDTKWTPDGWEKVRCDGTT